MIAVILPENLYIHPPKKYFFFPGEAKQQLLSPEQCIIYLLLGIQTRKVAITLRPFPVLSLL